jgi:hypothetical protein
MERKKQMKTVGFVFVIAFVVSTGVAQDFRSDAFQAISKTLDWSDNIKAYELEIVRQRTQAIAESETTFSSARIVRELLLGSSKFYICDTEGMWYLSLQNKGQSDSTKTVFRAGDSKSGKAWTKGFAEATINCPNGNCLNAARTLRWRTLPLSFALPIEPTLEEKQLDECIELILNKKRSRFLSGDQQSVKHFGKEKSARVFKIVFDLSNPAKNYEVFVGIELLVSAEGDDEGYVLSLKWYNLKADVEDALNPSNIVNLDRSVACQWEKRDCRGETVAVPVRVIQKYFQEGNKDSLTQTTSFDWKTLNELPVEISLKDFEASVKDQEQRVNKMLNR